MVNDMRDNLSEVLATISFKNLLNIYEKWRRF